MLYLLIFQVLLVLAMAGCQAQDATTSSPEGIWMETDPVQCLGNPWEKAWLSNHNGDYGDYPKGKPREVEPQEATIIKDFFEAEGIGILDLDWQSYPEDAMVCDACSCPQGFTLYLKVKEQNRKALEAYGFNLSSAYNPADGQ
jgi:hypothetical protein